MRDRMTGALTFGEALVGYATAEDALSTATQFTRFSGGADLNVAVGLSRLGVPATWASVLSTDPHGDYLAETVRGLGVTALVSRASGPTGLMFKAGGGHGDPEVLQARHSSVFAQHADAVLADVLPLRGYRHLHLTGIPLGISGVSRATTFALLEAATVAGITTSFDPNLRPNLFADREQMRETLNAVAARCTLILPGLAEGRVLTGRDDPAGIAAFYLEAGASEAAVKLGAVGATAWTATGESASAAQVTVSAVDTVGAGDGFAAGYLAALLQGQNLQQRVDQAACVGAMVTTRHGDLAAMPTQDQLREFRAARGQP